jgi:hypothetical protein
VWVEKNEDLEKKKDPIMRDLDTRDLIIYMSPEKESPEKESPENARRKER